MKPVRPKTVTSKAPKVPGRPGDIKKRNVPPPPVVSR